MEIFGSALMTKNNRLLLIYHRKNQAWLQPGGKINHGEPVLDGIYREIYEETGIASPLIRPNLNMVRLFSNYQDDGRRFIDWEIARVKLVIDYPHISWPQIAPTAIVWNLQVIDLFYNFSVTDFTVKLSAGEHEFIQWFEINNLLPDVIKDSLLQKLVISQIQESITDS